VKKTVNQDDRRMPHHLANYDGRKVAPHSSWTLFGYPSQWHPVLEGVGQTQRWPSARSMRRRWAPGESDALGRGVGGTGDRARGHPGVYFTDPESGAQS
jgi:hypothetical protein